MYRRLLCSTVPLGALLLALIGGTLAAPALAQPGRAGGRSLNPSTHLDLFVEKVDLIEMRVDLLGHQVEGEPLSRSPQEVQDLLFEANFAFLTEDYDTAALLYYSMLDNGDLAGNASEADAQFYLAESLFNARNYYPAQAAYQAIVEYGPIHPHYDDAVMKLIELFGLTGEIDQFNYYYDNFLQTTRNSAGPSALRVRYALGKTLYRQGKLGEAKQMFANFPSGSQYTPLATYHYGEILVREGYDKALAGDEAGAGQLYDLAKIEFEKVVQMPTSTDEQVSVLHLAYLALGAIYYEQGDETMAIESYRFIPQGSDHFDDALFQLCWAYVRNENYDAALRTIEIFLLAYPESTREPELKLLAAHLRVKLEQFEQAVIDYQAVVQEYEEIRVRLDHLVESPIDPMTYFNQLVDENYIVDAEYRVPELAGRMAREDARLNKAVEVASDLQGEKFAIAEGQGVVARIEEALYGEGSGDMMTSYRARRQEIDALDAQVLAMESELVEIEAAFIIEGLEGDASAVQSIRDRRRALQDEAAMAKSQHADRAEYQEDLAIVARGMELEAYKLDTMIEDGIARLAGVELYLKTQLEEGKMTEDEVQGHRLELEGIRHQLDGQQDRLGGVHATLDPRRETVSGVREASADELQQRTAVRAQIGELVEELVGYRKRVNRSNANQFFALVDQSRSRLRTTRQRTGTMIDALERREREEVDSIRNLLQTEKDSLASYDSEADGYDRDNAAVSGQLARVGFRNVQETFEDTVLQADMGAIDVFWMRKEALTKEREGLRDERSRTLRELKQMYEVLLEFEEEAEEEDEGGLMIE